MPDLFASAKSVLRRANHHITDIKTEIAISTPTKPYTYLVDDNVDGTQTHFFIFNDSFSDDISCIAFDAINNLRSCLDQMAYAIALKHRGRSKNFAYFPFAKDLKHWPNRINGAKNDFPSEIIALFERCRPYKGGNNTLWAIDYMANIKKHAILIPVGFGRATVWESDPGTDTILHGAWVSSKYEIKYTSPRSNQGSQRNFTYSIVISDAEEVIDGQSPVSLLDSMGSEIGAILSETEAVCRRIGLW